MRYSQEQLDGEADEDNEQFYKQGWLLAITQIRKELSTKDFTNFLLDSSIRYLKKYEYELTFGSLKRAHCYLDYLITFLGEINGRNSN